MMEMRKMEKIRLAYHQSHNLMGVEKFADQMTMTIDSFRALQHQKRSPAGQRSKTWIESRKRKDFLENLCFVCIITNALNEDTVFYMKSVVGGLHKLRSGPGRVPKLLFFTVHEPSALQKEEFSILSRVELHQLPAEFVDDPDRFRLFVLSEVAKEVGHVVFMQSGYVFDAAHASLGEAERTQDPAKIRTAIEYARKYPQGMYKNLLQNGYVLVDDVKEKVGALEGYVHGHSGYSRLEAQLKEKPDWKKDTKVFSSADMGITTYNPRSNLTCYLDVRPEAVYNTLLSPAVLETMKSEKYVAMEKIRPRAKRLAVGFPTTSKGLAPNADPVMFKAIIPTLLESITELEWENYIIDVYIGFDHGDPLFDNEVILEAYAKKLNAMFGERPIRAIFVRLPKSNWLGMLWSILFHRAMSIGGADYFYQVNDDLRIVTKGWLTKFTAALDGNGGYGVVGPCDNQVGFCCKLLTQAMVSRLHYEIFAMFYPLELRDWKTDVWLTKVYGRESSFCWPEYVANNGATQTRYNHCPAPYWKLALEDGRKKIAQWKQRTGR